HGPSDRARRAVQGRSHRHHALADATAGDHGGAGVGAVPVQPRRADPYRRSGRHWGRPRRARVRRSGAGHAGRADRRLLGLRGDAAGGGREREAAALHHARGGAQLHHRSAGGPADDVLRVRRSSVVNTMTNSRLRLSADVGGTFTDVAAFDDTTGRLRLGKTLTTPPRLVTGIETGVTKAGAGFSAAQLFLHGTTVAINTILERTGATCALITTQGFRDIYEIGRVNRP